MTTKELGQYFTTNKQLQEKVYDFILNKPSLILEPSIGQGDLVQFIQSQISSIKFDMYEIDTNIKLLDTIQKDLVIYGDFMKQPITKTYTTIVGNPPYVRTKKGNLYIDFTERCFHLLEDKGELIFIVPSDFFKLTSASKVLNKMLTSGSFTHIYHPHNEKMFEKACIDIIVFRYCKNASLAKKVLYNAEAMHIVNNDGMVTFCKEEPTHSISFKDYFDIYVGIVSGKESVYKNTDLGNIEVLNGENKKERYIYIEEYPCSNPQVNTHLEQHKKELISRGIRKFNETNWFEWGALRNIKNIQKSMDQDCIYIYNLTRNPKVSFVGKVGYFGGGLIMLKPKSKKNCNLYSIVAYLNSDKFKNNFMFSGRFKIGHRQLANSFLPLQYLK